MSRKKAGLKDPSYFSFKTSTTVGEYVRLHAFQSNMGVGEMIEEALIDYLIKVGKVDSRESLLIQEQMEK